MVTNVDTVERLSMFFPIKVVNGFVTCDFKLGCYCCKFCLNRRNPDWHRLLETGRVYPNPLTVERAAALLSRVKALTHAGVTLKIGHDTDESLEEAEAQALWARMPADQPIVFMRRGPLRPAFRAFYAQPHSNLLVELTLTPRSDYLEYHTDPFPILRSFEGVATNMFYTVGPVCHDNVDEAREILRRIPAGSKVWVRDLIFKDIPRYAATSGNLARGEALREFAADRGLTVVSYLNCVVRAQVGRTFHKGGEFASEPNAWQLRWSERCAVRDACCCERPAEEEVAAIDAAMGEIGLALAQTPRKFAYKSYDVLATEDVNFGDECYVRERTGLKVDLARPGQKTGTALTESIAARWRERDLFPVDEMLEMAREMFRTGLA